MAEGKLRIVVDTREQRPWQFSDGVEVIRAALPAGDYSLQGFEDVLAIERKSLSDFLMSIAGGRERFLREMRRLRGYRLRAVVIEDATIEDILFQRYLAKVHPNAVLGTVASLAVKFDMPVYLLPTPELAADFVERLFRLFVKYIERDFRRIKGMGKGANNTTLEDRNHEAPSTDTDAMGACRIEV